MKAAQDGLLPDGREGAIVPYREDVEGGGGEQNAQWIPMVAGIRKKVRNSGLLRDWNVQVVQEGDVFQYELGDDPYIKHVPAPRGGRARSVLFAYSIATYPDGTKSREVMNIDQIEDVRKKSKARKGPWADPIFYPEMCRKTVAKLHAKQLPSSTDLDTVLRRDDELYDFKGEREASHHHTHRRLENTKAALDYFAGGEPDHGTTASSAEPSDDGGAAPQSSDSERTGNTAADEPSGAAAPKTTSEYREQFDAVLEHAHTGPELEAWFKSEPQRKLRHTLQIPMDQVDQMKAVLAARVKELEV